MLLSEHYLVTLVLKLDLDMAKNTKIKFLCQGIQKSNSVRDNVQDKIRKKNFVRKKNSQTEFCLGHCLGLNLSWTEFCLGFPVHFFELSRTNRCLSSLIGIHIPQLITFFNV